MATTINESESVHYIKTNATVETAERPMTMYPERVIWRRAITEGKVSALKHTFASGGLTFGGIPCQMPHSVESVEGEWCGEEGLARDLCPLGEALDELDDVGGIDGNANDGAEEVGEGETVKD